MAEKRIIKIDASTLTALQKCAYYTFLNYVKHLRAVQTSETLERGDFTHYLLEHYYRSLAAQKSWEESVAIVEELGRKKYPEYMGLDASYAEWIIQSFLQYANHWRHDGLEVIAVEQPFLLKVYEDDEIEGYYEGKIDLIAKIPLVGITVYDHKSRKRRNEETLLNNQFVGYSLATETNFVYVNEFGLQTSKKPEEKFRRIPLSYPDTLKNHWLNNVIPFWYRQLDWFLQENIWPESWNPYNCVNCVFSSVCKSGSQEEKFRKLASEFKEGEPWDVTKVLEGENG